MIPYLGDFAEDATVYIPFNTFDSNDPSASVTITNLADADIMVHKDGGTTQIATDGATVAIDYDGVTGNHLITVDTSVHADYATGSDYMVRIEGTTVDAGTINAWVAQFSIENRYNDVNTASITAGAITAAAIATGAIDADSIATDAITNAKIAADAIGASEIAADAIGASELAAGAVTEITDDIMAEIIETEGSVTLQQALSTILAFAAGVTSGQDTASPVFNAPNSATSRITGTTDGSGNRTATAITPSS